MEYNAKINTNGDYRKFYGWTVISMVENDLKFIENYISKNNTLKNYFSALPSSSYHMTIYNLWSNGSKLLKHQRKFIEQNFSAETVIELKNQSKHIGYFNPNGCIDNLLYRLYFECQKENVLSKIVLKIKNVNFTGNTIQILLEDCEEFSKINSFRNNMISICEKDDNMGKYHITLAYKYKTINDEAIIQIKEEIRILNVLLFAQTVTLNRPGVYSFEDMTYFKPL